MKLFYSYMLGLIIVTAFSPIVSAEPENELDNLLKEGILAASSQDYDKAVSYFDKVLEIDPKNIDALNNKGVVLGSSQQYDKAVSYFDQVLEIDPKNIDALNNKGAALIKLSEFDKAVSYFDKVLEIDPKNLVAQSNKEVVLNRGIIYDALSDSSRFAIYVQVLIRNSNGQLVAYLESTRVDVPDPKFLDVILDTRSTGKSIITINDKEYEKIKITHSGSYVGPNTAATITGSMWGDRWALRTIHDGTPLVEGDKIDSVWTIIRPVK